MRSLFLSGLKIAAVFPVLFAFVAHSQLARLAWSGDTMPNGSNTFHNLYQPRINDEGAVHRVLEPFFAAVRRMRKELDKGFEPWLISKQLAAIKLNQEK